MKKYEGCTCGNNADVCVDCMSNFIKEINNSPINVSIGLSILETAEELLIAAINYAENGGKNNTSKELINAVYNYADAMRNVPCISNILDETDT